jgi:hypothetical protein
VKTFDRLATSTVASERAVWVGNVHIQLAREKGWKVEDTQLRVVSEEEAAPHVVRFQYRDSRTGKKGNAVVRTNDPDATASDQGVRDRWLARVSEKHATKHGWQVEYTHVESCEDGHVVQDS